jgi:fructose-bisphosphate aldolase class II
MLLSPALARLLFQDALERGYAILAINADSPAAVGDCLEAARRSDSPIIIETSLWQLKGHSFGMGDAVLGLARYLSDLDVLAGSATYAGVPVIFHTDHIKGPETRRILRAAIEGVPVTMGGTEVRLRASTISLDSSELTERENVELACELCGIGEATGAPIALELEAGVDDGLTDGAVTERLLAPVERRYPGHLALWAPGVGTRHGLTEGGYPTFSASHVKAQAQLAARLLGRRIGIALHGSSGLPEESLQAAVQAGVVKVNWSSESLLLRSQAARAYYAENGFKLEAKHPEFKVTAMDNGVQHFVSEAYIDKVRQRLATLNSTGKAPAFRHKHFASSPIQG